MLKNDDMIEIPWTQTAQSYFNKKGYSLVKGGTIKVYPNELPDGSHRRVSVICDGCQKEIQMEYRQYFNKSKKFNGKYYCKKCAPKTEEIKKRRIDGIFKKYGVQNPMQDEKIFIKQKQSFLKDNEIPTSKQQKQIYNLLLENYQNVFLNYSEGKFSLDCMLQKNGIKIDIEYDGWYWHQRQNKDTIRDKILQKKGYKIIRIKGGRTIPSTDVLLKTIEDMISSNKNYTEIILSEYIEREKDYKIKT